MKLLIEKEDVGLELDLTRLIDVFSRKNVVLSVLSPTVNEKSFTSKKRGRKPKVKTINGSEQVLAQ
jgi:hypothetical protein